MTHVFVMPSQPQTAIDQAIADEAGVLRSTYNGRKTLEEMQAVYPGIQLVTEADYWKGHDEALRTHPTRITEETYQEALDCLPPIGWTGGAGSQSFKFREFYSGHITTIYARHRGRYWMFRDTYKLAHADILRRVDAFVDGEGALAKTA